MELVIFIGAFFAAFFGSMAGGGAGFISMLTLMNFLPMQEAIATYILGNIGFYAAGASNFKKVNLIEKKTFLQMLCIAIPGAIIGALLLIQLNDETLKWIITGFLIPVFIILLLNRNIGITDRDSHWTWVPVFFLANIFQGMFSSGGGALNTTGLIVLKGFTALRAMAYYFFVSTINYFFIITILISQGVITHYVLGLIVLIGNFIGAFLGSKIALKQGNQFIKKVMLVIIVVTLLKLWI